ncbi:MAG TPA: mRNA surveillance protein pelota [Methanophagales archaeon]|nr:mRNA surveillance protein pelota [Methanophagales archaeon]
MKILKRKIKGGRKPTGEISLVPESLDDLWHLKHVIESGDLVYSLTYRRIEAATDKVRPDKIEKKPIRLGMRVESVEFHKFSRRLRIKGVIEEGLDTELGSYHTFNIEPGVQLSISKDWKEHQLKRLREAEKAVDSPDVIIATIEDGEAVAGVVRQYGVDELFSVRYGSGKGDGGSSKTVFFEDVLKHLKNSFLSLDAEAIIIAGPGFIKDDFFSFVKDKDREFAKQARIEQTSSIGVSGFIEVLKRGAVERLRKEERLTREVKLMDRLMAEISKEEGEKAVYGTEEVRKALQYGAIETLMVCDERLMVPEMEAEEEGRWGKGERRGERGEGREEIERLLEEVERGRGKIVVFSTEFEPGKRLKGLGGIAALLRFPI